MLSRAVSGAFGSYLEKLKVIFRDIWRPECFLVRRARVTDVNAAIFILVLPSSCTSVTILSLLYVKPSSSLNGIARYPF